MFRAGSILIGSTTALALACAAPVPTPEEEIRAVMSDLIEAIEARVPGEVLEHVAFEFEAQDGVGYPEVQSLVLTYLLRDEVLGARLEQLEIEPAGQDAARRVRARVAFVRGTRLAQSQVPLPFEAVEYDFDLIFARRGGDWQAVSGSYQRR